MDQRMLGTAKKKLASKLAELIESTKIEDELVADLSQEYEAEILNLQTTNVSIQIDKTAKCIFVDSKKTFLKEIKSKILALLKKLDNNPEFIKSKKGLKAYLLHMGSKESVQFPPYWTTISRGEKAIAFHEELNASSTLYKNVERLVSGTWDAGKAGGLGRDAEGLKHQQIAVRKIWRIEQQNQFIMYDTKRRQMCMHAAINPIASINGLKGEAEVMTRKLDCKELESNNIISEINEYYLLHGTRKNLVDNIVCDGLDSRLAGDSTGTLFGRGIYMAESSTKADQYADERTNRVGAGQPLNMIVVRVLLGNTFVCDKPQQFRRPPCTFAGCLQDNCSDKAHGGLFFDSVLGTHRVEPSHQRLIFREFLVYDKTQCYPEFLIEYIRQ
jgi:hypothetical protein